LHLIKNKFNAKERGAGARSNCYICNYC